jgi:hypothetical protein
MSAKAAVTVHLSDWFAGYLFSLCENAVQGVAIIRISMMRLHTDYPIILRCHRNAYFTSEFVSSVKATVRLNEEDSTIQYLHRA